MDISKTNSLVELFFDQAQKFDPNRPLLNWLKSEYNQEYSWSEVEQKILKLTNYIKNNIKNRYIKKITRKTYVKCWINRNL